MSTPTLARSRPRRFPFKTVLTVLAIAVLWPRLSQVSQAPPKHAPPFKLAALSGGLMAVDPAEDARSKLVIFWASW